MLPCRERARFDRCTKLKEFDGPVFYDGAFFASVEDLIDEFEEDELPEYVYTSMRRGPLVFSPESLIDSMRDDSWEGWEPDCEQELIDFLEQWNAKQTSYWFEEDLGTVLLLRGAHE